MLASADYVTCLDVGPAGVAHVQHDAAVPPAVRASAHAYRGAERNRIWRDWEPRHRSGDAAIYQDYDLLTARLRDLFRNEPVMRKLKREIVKHVISAQGIQTFADVLMQDGAPGEQEPDDLFNFESDELFEQWAEEEADAEGKFSWSQMQWQYFSEILESGGALMLQCADDSPGRSLPLCYQVLEYEQLDSTLDRPAGRDGANRIVRGIELDARNRPVAYHIFDAHPYDYLAGIGIGSKSTRVPASRVIHTYFPNRPSENMGATLFSANIQSAKDLDWLIGNELTSAALGALLTLVVKRKYGAGTGIGFTGDAASTSGNSDDYGNSLVKWGRGVVADIGPEDDVKVAESGRPSQQIAPFADLLFQLHGMAAGVSHGRVTGNYKGTSYSAARAMHLDDQAFFVVLQSMSARGFVKPVRKQHTVQAAAYGLYTSISPIQFRNARRQMLRVDVQAAGREYLDPEAEGAAATQRIKACLSTWKDEAGLRGKNWRRLALQQKRERAFFARHGIEPDLEHSAGFLARQAAKAARPEERETGEDVP